MRCRGVHTPSFTPQLNLEISGRDFSACGLFAAASRQPPKNQLGSPLTGAFFCMQTADSANSSVTLVTEDQARSPGFDLTEDRLISDARHNLFMGNYEEVPSGILVRFKARRFDDESDAFVSEDFAVGFYPTDNKIEITHIGKDQRATTLAQRPLHKYCLAHNSRNSLEIKIDWLVRGYRHPKGQVSLDWGRTDFAGSVIWYTANGWLAPTPHMDDNSMGGSWHRALITDKGRQHVQKMGEVVLFEDVDGTQFAFDPAGWFINHSPKQTTPRWIRTTPPVLTKATVLKRISVWEFAATEFGYPQIG